MSYGEMALVYDRLMKDAPYDLWVEFTKQMIGDYQPDTRTILDIGCGTGEITHRLQQIGFQLTGVDLSSDMLTVAQQKDPRANIQWLKQDMTNLEGLDQFDCVISYCDVFNYLVEESQVKCAFENIYDALHSDGLFLFDVHSLEHIHNDLSGATFAQVHDDLSYVWFCDPGEEDNSIVHDLTFFVQSGEIYQRFDEVHHQRGYMLDDLKNWLEDTGFLIQQISADFNRHYSTEGERWLFVCKK
ncbi:class I SAM-dependent DNA methyltransferase [Halobacillus sp. H74]|uniref:class I SAM-dependent DNA methyltransferase n=1 Tax=Halobacillus sp. H74 TaxID=3457436 RepID=UPI003FCED4F2